MTSGSDSEGEGMNKEQKKKIDQIVCTALRKLNQVPIERYPEVYNTLNGWGWHEQLGDEPAGWAEMQLYERGSVFRFWKKRTITKFDITTPIIDYIKSCVGEKALYRYRFVHVSGRTDQQFEDWYEQRRYLKK